MSVATASPSTTPPEKTVRPDDILAMAQSMRWQIGGKFHEKIVEATYTEAAAIADTVVTRSGEKPRFDLDRAIDQILTSRRWGFPVMILLFAVVFWITIIGSNYPSQVLDSILIGWAYPGLKGIANTIGMPWWLSGLLIDGMYLTTAWVIAVMLPPMAIFFPLFTLLEDAGYLPRVAFNLDNAFRKSGAHGKQSLTMMMGFGCNAAGVIATRIIDSPRERLIAMITNNFSLCNGRWPTLILIAIIFIGALAPAHIAGLVSAAAVVGITVLGVLLTFLVSRIFSSTALKGEASVYSLELPPYRPPRVLQTIYTSLIDRTMYVLWRALVFALPAGAVIWLIANINIGGTSIAEYMINFLNPFGILLGLNGIILVAYIVAIPANEIIIPTVLMLTVLVAGGAGPGGAGAGVIFDTQSQDATYAILSAGGWTLLTAVNVMIFTLLHNPCSTTIYTIYKESGSVKWTVVAALFPLAMGFVATFLIAQFWRLLAG